MRLLLLLAIVVALAVWAVIRPKIGVYAIVWFSLMRPDVWAWSSLQYPYASILELGTMIGCVKVLMEGGGPLMRNAVFRMLIALQIPIALSVVFAIHPTLCYEPYRWYIGCVLSAVMIGLVIQTEKDFRKLVVIAALSIGYLGARFGLYGLMQGGVRYGGGYGANLSDNNTLGLALAMGVPLAWYGKDLIKSVPIRFSLLISAFLTIAAVIFTYSRGAAIALAGAFLVIVIHSRRRLLLLIGLAILTGPTLYLVKDSYFDRMETLNGTETAQKDKSVRERMETARVASRMWQDYPIIGVGFGMNNQMMLWFNYADTAVTGKNILVIHNTYLQMLVDSGTFALAAYITLLLGTVFLMERSAWRLKRAGSPLYGCPLAIEGGLVTFIIGSTFLTRVTFDFTYILVMMAASWLIVEPEHLQSLEEQREAEEALGEDLEPVEAGA